MAASDVAADWKAGRKLWPTGGTSRGSRTHFFEGSELGGLTAPTKEFEKLVVSGKLRHGGNPVLRWMAANVAAEMDAAGNIKPSK